MKMVGEKGRPPTSDAALGVRRGLWARFFAWSLAHAGDAHHRHFADRKRVLFGRLGGGEGGPPTVVEIGAGAGPNAVFFPEGTRWIAIEPNVHFHHHLHAAAAQYGLALEIRDGTAESLPLGADEADVVVSTLVLCSVADPEAALAETRRVLKPGGRFVFVEHVAAPRGTGLRLAQRAVKWPWRVVGDGCRLDRETGSLIEAAGFSDVEIEHFRAPLGLVAPHVAGVATA